jgi:serine protease Do
MKTLPGGSGSPVFDGEGKLVAMVKGRYRGTDIVGFLTPLDIMRQFLDER